jgi:hypothetical protein
MRVYRIESEAAVYESVMSTMAIENKLANDVTILISQRHFRTMRTYAYVEPLAILVFNILVVPVACS